MIEGRLLFYEQGSRKVRKKKAREKEGKSAGKESIVNRFFNLH